MKALIVSLGGSPEPVLKVIREYQPGFVCFFASEKSVETIGAIKQQLGEEGIEIDNTNVIVEDIDDIVHCYAKAISCAGKIEKKGISVEDVIVDYTGGTKTMTAALTLATVGKGYRFSYVGGADRNKKGLGTVISGTEVIHTGVSPWQIFAVEEKRQIALLVNHYNYDAALEFMNRTRIELPAGDRILWDQMVNIIQGYRDWDIFDHMAALTTLQNGLNGLENSLSLKPDSNLEAFMLRVRENYETLGRMCNETKGFNNKMKRSIGLDMVSNACRRAEQGRYDDAVARLYRALELIGQIAFKERFGCSTANVDPQKLPKSIQEDYKNRYSSEEKADRMKLPLYATFNALHEAEDPVGKQYFEKEKEFKGILAARNDSILAHGFITLRQKSFEGLYEIIKNSFFAEEPLIDFPKLRWE